MSCVFLVVKGEVANDGFHDSILGSNPLKVPTLVCFLFTFLHRSFCCRYHFLGNAFGEPLKGCWHLTVISQQTIYGKTRGKDVCNQARFEDAVGIFPEFIDGHLSLSTRCGTSRCGWADHQVKCILLGEQIICCSEQTETTAGIGERLKVILLKFPRDVLKETCDLMNLFLFFTWIFCVHP